MEKTIYDFVGIGIGPFNLSLAALADKQDKIDGVFFDQTSKMQWHPGMLIQGTDLQVPFMADLVTFADPTSPYTFLNYLHKNNRIYPFFYFQKLEVPRPEYNDYLKWVADQLPSLFFGQKVIDVKEIDLNDEEKGYVLDVQDQETGDIKQYRSRHIVIGTGSKPSVIPGAEELPKEDIVHTSRYLYEKESILRSNHVTVIGSGQSAAEIVDDLLSEQDDHHYKISWFTRSAGIFQLDTAKLPQELFSPEYVDYFNSLTYEQRMNTLPKLDKLQNGVDPSTLSDIYDWLYHKSVAGKQLDVTIQPLTELTDIKPLEKTYMLELHQWQEDETIHFETDKLILATGYKPNIPTWLKERFGSEIVWEGNEHYKLTRDCEIVFHDGRQHMIFATTDIEHSHATGDNNLGLAVDRNMRMINTMAGETVYPQSNSTIFQQFTMKRD
ncbi:ornithine monooxygenase [Pontibacillus yanchengensis Y32]|uniref:L-lysine N6-monooxygenase MbtG n=2 Tax=Pontibacillus yanchengensis TaxID=462910 RepID=A0A0A2TAI7_9BACI|nr:ornithine monooxygenase [Pontibacillus yanchengensis Y32]